jgi:ankyrin repeat protein
MIQNGWSPLLYASYYGHPEIIRILLNQNARVDVFDDVSSHKRACLDFCV